MKGVWHFAGLMAFGAGSAWAQSIPAPAGPADFPSHSADQVLLGRDLFFDPILSGNQNISCATCHHPKLGSADEMSLSLGEGALGLGRERKALPDTALHARIPRNAPALFNVGAHEFTALFHDGRVAHDDNARFNIAMPPGATLEAAVDSVLAAQSLMPITSADEMAGAPGENPIADAVAAGRIAGPDGVWAQLAARVEEIPSYKTRFNWLRGEDAPLHITEVGNAIAAFMSYEFRSTDSSFDAFLLGDSTAMSQEALKGMSLFYGEANCASCHAGVFQTDHAFHALGLPPIGPGKGHGPSGYADHGRAAVTGDKGDLYRFRTPSLRNVTLTGPYGHNGAYAELEDMIRHHLDPLTMLAEYTPAKARLHEVDLEVSDTESLRDFDEMLRIATSVTITPPELEDREIAAIMAFLEALEDKGAHYGRLGLPDYVPSGLPLDPLPSEEVAAVTEPAAQD